MSREPLTGVPPAWFWGFWLPFGLLGALQQSWINPALPPGVAHWEPPVFGFVRTMLWSVLCLAVFAVARRFPLEPGAWRRNMAVGIGAVVVLAQLLAVGQEVAARVVGYPPLPMGEAVLARGPGGILIGLHLLGAGHGVAYARRARERRLATSQLAARLAESRLYALKAQLQPHFLFNTFHSISALMFRDPAAADRMLDQLSDLLRRTLDRSHVQEVPLAEEIQLLRTYLEIEGTRFSDRLTARVEVPEALEGAAVPHLLLQPLVENAVRHGIARRRGPGRVWVRARAEGDVLVLEVEDDGVGLHAPSPVRGTGIGLRNTRARLAALYGAGQSLHVGPAPAQGTRVEIRLPLRAAAERGEPGANAA